MSVARPARCLFSTPPKVALRPRPRCRNFHTSLQLLERRRPRFANVKASTMGLVQSPHEMFKKYSEEEKDLLKDRYTPEQLEAIEAGEEAITPEDLDRDGVIRTDLGSLTYLDDLSRLKPIYDRKPPDDTPYDPNTRLMTEDEMGHSFLRSLDKVEAENPNPQPPEDLARDSDEWRNYSRKQRLNIMKAQYQMETFMGTNGPLPWVPDLLAPALPRKFLEESSGPTASTEDELLDPEGVYLKLRKQTGLTMREIVRLNVKILVRHRVVNQTRLGKIDSMYCLAIAGNGDGRLGIGEAKGQEAEDTQINARIAAIRNMRPVPRYEERTIFGEVEGKVSAVHVQLMARPPGFGLRCQHNIFEMARAAGIRDLAARVPRARNKMNTVKAAYQALMRQRIPDEIARGRGKKLVDVRKVYYGGRV